MTTLPPSPERQSAEPTANDHRPQAESRVAPLLDRLAAAARQAAEAAQERATQRQQVVVPFWLQEELDDIDSIIRDLKAAKGYLSTDEGRMLAEAKHRRRVLRQQVDELERPAMERARGWEETAERIHQALKKQRRLPGEHEQLELLVPMLDPLKPLLNAAERNTLREAVKRLQTLQAAQTRAEPTPEETAEGAEATERALTERIFRGLRDYLPEPAEPVFGAADQDIVARLTEGRLEDEESYRLNLAAIHLSLAGGFEALVCLPLLHGVEHFAYQVDTARQVLRVMRGRALLCDEVGLGKTIEAGLILKEYMVRGLVRRALVLAPPALVSQWREEMAVKFGIGFVTHEDAAFRSRGIRAWENFDLLIASLHTAKQAGNSEVIHRQTYDLVIVDEAHHLKNRDTVSWQFVNGLKSRYLLLLTATPAQNNLDELFNLITLLSPGQLKTPAAFRREFVERGNPRRPKNRVKLRELLMDVMVRNSRSQVQVSLPPRRATTVRIAQTAIELALYEATTKFVRGEHREGGNRRLVARTLQAEAGSSAAALRATLHSMLQREAGAAPALEELCALAGAVSSSAKAEALLKLLGDTHEKALVFTQYRETQRFLLQLLEQRGVACARFSGDLNAAEKDEQIAHFARDRNVLVSTDIGSEGRNLQFCSTLVNYDLPWNPMKIEQRVGRVHRIGQTEPVKIFNLAARDTIEDYILQVLDEKINMFELVIGEVGEIIGNMEDEREFEDIVLQLWAGAESVESAREAFASFGDQLVEARKRYAVTKQYDEELFGQDFGPEK